jgi:FtsH-binding integral membrane protein
MTTVAAGAAMVPAPALAHVKWFSEFSFADRPLSAAQVLTPLFFGLAVLSMVVIGGMVVLDRRLENAAWYRGVNEWLADRRDQAPLVMRIGVFATLLLAWQADALLVPELRAWAPWVGWAHFWLALFVLFPRTVPLTGGGLIALYGLAAARYGGFHLLDYIFFAGVGWYLLVSGSRSERIRGTGIPALYASVGFSLCWVALEKIIYPQWALHILNEYPQLSLGFDLRFFLLGAAFVEFSLGYLLIINLLQRPLALVITLVFFTTTLVFGKLEVIGHTPIHAALVVFLLEGRGTVYRPPIALHKRLGLRTAFAAVNFALLLAILLPLYAAAARVQMREASDDTARVVPEVDGMETIGLMEIERMERIEETEKRERMEIGRSGLGSEPGD